MRRSIVLALLLGPLGPLGCAEAAPRLREHTYPPSFEYVDRSHLHSAMWTLAGEMTDLDHKLRDPAGDPAQQQQDVADLLKRVEETVDGIATPGRVTQHPLLNRNLPRFREMVQRARDGVSRTPPSYYSATALTGICSACHAGAQT